MARRTYVDSSVLIAAFRGEEAAAERAEEVPSSPALTEEALAVACRYGLSALDALHVAAAVVGRADELVTLEKSEKPICRIAELRVRSLHSAGSPPDGAGRGAP